MKKTAIVILFISFISLGILGRVYADNLLLNPSFEDELNYWDDLWGLPSDLSDIAHSGTASATKFVDAGLIQTQDYWSQIFQEVDFIPGEPVYSSVYLKTTFSALATAQSGLMLQFMDDDDNVLGSTLTSKTIGGQTDWRLVEVSAQAAPEGTTKARLSGFIWSLKDDTSSLQGQAYYDDTFLAKEYRSIPFQGQLFNPGFENGLHDWQELYGFPATLSTDTAYSGTYAVKKTIGQIPGLDYWSQIYQDIACAPAKKITASVYVKTNFLPRALARAGLLIEVFNAQNKVIKKISAKIGKVADWRKIIAKILRTPANTKRIRFSLFIYAPAGEQKSVGKAAYYDECVLLIQ